jgi:hypothetical protein
MQFGEGVESSADLGFGGGLQDRELHPLRPRGFLHDSDLGQAWRRPSRRARNRSRPAPDIPAAALSERACQAALPRPVPASRTSPVRWPGSRPLDREHPGVQPVACRSQAARSGEPAPPDAALLSRLSLQRSVPGVWLLRAGIQMSVPSWRQFPSLSARQHLGAADRDQCGACHSGCRFFSACAVHRCPPAALFGFGRGRSGPRVLRELEGSTTGLSRRQYPPRMADRSARRTR